MLRLDERVGFQDRGGQKQSHSKVKYLSELLRQVSKHF